MGRKYKGNERPSDYSNSRRFDLSECLVDLENFEQVLKTRLRITQQHLSRAQMIRVTKPKKEDIVTD